MSAAQVRPRTPAQAWAELCAGNQRFVEDRMEHPSQGFDRRAELSVEQHPFAVVFGCSDSRVAAEIIFDQGLGDLFVVRTAGHVLDTTVIGSIEYGVRVLGAPLVVVLAHDSCGAVAATVEAMTTGNVPPGFVQAVVDRVIPSIVGLTASGRPLDSFDAATLGHQHVLHTARQLHGYSVLLAEDVAAGRCAVVAVEYTLADGQARLTHVIGDIGAGMGVIPPTTS
ncbi:carbonic anhydrase [Cellulomonas wangsupingiae]|uniref:carbonic anhydrase n=1 Tax=Cellulomonas wangsupingiae TaxID=2968085 RepID=A0ABY5KAC7_9CELL|nr:carbonic anhydrase [Cellulomonas wangsupingiae]MCC2334415.1 carbonic anhydrase [Cellulomonas wangsupingiae]UUI66082.1 carbonic anhydrase [Cellulomonas wangsupingiae]